MEWNRIKFILNEFLLSIMINIVKTLQGKHLDNLNKIQNIYRCWSLEKSQVHNWKKLIEFLMFRELFDIVLVLFFDFFLILTNFFKRFSIFWYLKWYFGLKNMKYKIMIKIKVKNVVCAIYHHAESNSMKKSFHKKAPQKISHQKNFQEEIAK